MKRYKVLSIVFTAFAVILSDIMCFHVAYEYSKKLWGNQLNSAPSELTFVLAIPYSIGIVFSIILSYVFYKKFQKAKTSLN